MLWWSILCKWNQFFSKPKQSWRIDKKKLIKDINNKKIVNLANLTENEDAVNKKYLDNKKLKQSIFSFFLSKYANRGLFTKTFVKEKEKCCYHTNQNSNSELLHYYYFSVTAFDQSGLSSHMHATQSNTISLRPRISTSSNNETQLFFFSKNWQFDLSL